MGRGEGTSSRAQPGDRSPKTAPGIRLDGCPVENERENEKN